jgi:hypothetical protein
MTVRVIGRFDRRAALSLFGAGLVLPLLAPRLAGAGEDPRRAVVAMVEQACDALSAHGFPRGIGRAAPDTWSRLDSGLYVFLLDRSGRLLLHRDGMMEGRDVSAAQDAAGTYFIREILALATARPAGGWVNYLWSEGRDGAAGSKHTFCKRAVTPAGRAITAAAGYVATEI